MRTRANRVVTAVVAVVAVVVVVLLFTGGKSYTVTAQMTDASQLVLGNQVRIAGAPIGSVSSIELANDGKALVKLKITDKQYDPLPEGTVAIVRNSTLTGVANRFVSLEPGPNSNPPIKDGGFIQPIDTRSSTDLDAILTTFDAQGRQYLESFINGTAGIFAGSEAGTRRTLEYLNPALGQTRALADEISGDTPNLNRLLARTAAVSAAIAQNRDNFEQGLVSTAATLRAAANQRAALQDTIRRAPQFLRRANTTFVNARPLLDDARPLLREVVPTSKRLSTTLRIVQPLAAQTRPLLANVRSALPDLNTTLRRLPTLSRTAVPTLNDVTTAVNGVTPIVQGLRPYVPDVLQGLLENFGGRALGYYDADGHWGRLELPVGANSFGEGLGLLGQLTSLASPLTGLDFGQSGTSIGNVNRCPGAAAGTSEDGKSPFRVPTCDFGQNLPGYKAPNSTEVVK